MRYFKKLASLTNLGFRASTLVLRFLLSFYIVKYLGYEATGIYGLAIGAIAIAPAVLGWGLNYFVSREIVGTLPAFAGGRIKSRLFVTTVSLVIATIFGAVMCIILGHPLTLLYALILVLIWLETYGLDIHMALIAQEMAVQANIIVFVRSALWVPFAIGLGMGLPIFRSLETVFSFWIFSYLLSAVVLGYFLRRWPIKEISATPIQYDWIQERLKYSWYIYISDLSNVGLAYSDRYIVSYMLGLTLTGVYTFFWSLTNALQTLIQTAVTQIAIPRLHKAFAFGSIKEWKGVFKQELVRTTAFATALGALVFLASEVLIRSMSMAELGEHRGLFVLMLLAAVIRACSDIMSGGLASLKKDSHYASINLVGVFVAVFFSWAAIRTFGLIGTGLASLITAVLLLGVRAIFIYKFASKMKG